jgi:hypothetical protein
MFTETTHESWFSRIGNSFKSLLFGLLLFAISFPLLFWNEGRAVKTAKSLNEGESVTVSVSSDAVDPANEGKFVHTVGLATTEETIRDDMFALEANAIRIKRIAEMYQWKEDKKTETKKKLGGGKDTVTTYQYNKAWSPQLISSANFKQSDGHRNPESMPINSDTITATKVTLGAFQLPPNLVSAISGGETITVSEANIPAQFQDRMKLRGSGELYLGSNPGAPQVGDVRVKFQATPPAEVSILAQQQGETFQPYQTEAGRALSMLEMGKHDAKEMFQHARDSNNMMTWILRAVGAGMMFGGLAMLMSPLAVLGDVIPIVGSIVGGGTMIVAGLITLTLAPLTVAVAWMFYRPLIAIPLLLISATAAYFLWQRRKSQALPEVMTMEEGS